MAKILHIVSHPSGAGTLKQCLGEMGLSNKVEASFDILIHGPLPKDFSEKELTKRAQYIATLFRCSALNVYREIEHLINLDFDQYDKIVIWHSNNVEEQLLLYMLCSLINKELCQADITALYEVYPRFRDIGVPLSLGSCSSDNMRIIYDKIEPISSELKQEYAQRWDYWSKSDAAIRIMSDSRILEVDENYFDDFILSRCSNEYKSAARVIGDVIGYNDQLIGDGFILTRVIELIRQEKLTAFNHVDPAHDIALCKNLIIELMRQGKLPELYHVDPVHNISLYNNRVIINGVDVTNMRIFSVKLRV